MSPGIEQAPGAPTSGRRWRAVSGALLGLGLLGWVLHQAQGAPWGQLLRPTAVWSWCLASALLWALSYLLRAWRLQLEWQGRVALDLPGCWRAVVQHNLVLAVLPMRLGEVGYVWALHHRWGLPWREAARSLLWLRLQDALVLGLLALGAWGPALVPWLLARPAGLWGALLLGLGLAGAACAGHAGLRSAVWRRASSLAQALHHAGGARHTAAWGWLCCWANWLAKLLATALLLAAWLGLPAHPDTLAPWLRAALAGEWAAALPLQAPAGLGSYEAALVWAAPGGAVAPAALAAAALLTHGAALLTLGLCAALTAAWPERAGASASPRWTPSTRLP